jgi:D-3-phosphoglycerate dehydrogenase
MFDLMKPGAFFINTSRGELIDEIALLKQLESGTIRGAALDVLSNEQTTGMGQNALVKYAHSHQNLIITPHIGGCTAESMGKAEHFLAQELYCALRRWAGRETAASAS